MEKFVAKFGGKYLRRYEIERGLASILLTDDLFDAMELDRKNYGLLAKLIGLGADITAVSIFEYSHNYDIKKELMESEEVEK